MNNPFDYTPDVACDEAFRQLAAGIAALKESDSPADRDFCRELEAGKMLGVMIAADAAGTRHTLYAFSGQLGDGGFHRSGFVGPVFDYLQPDGYFKTKEAEISRLSHEIAEFEAGPLAGIKSDYEKAKKALEADIEAYRGQCRRSKRQRDAVRDAGGADEAKIAAMVRQSQFEKAELHRMKKKAAAALEPSAAALREAGEYLDTLKDRRRSRSEALQQWLFTNFRLLNARGESKSLSEIFAGTPMRIPPSGAGECCAPKLLQAAYVRGWRPVAMAEYWYGRPKGGEVRVHGAHYPACRGKCLPVLGWMLQGLDVEPPLGSDLWAPADGLRPEIIFENGWFCVVDKPAGMLSVPGKGPALSVQRWLEDRYGPERHVKLAHRLDQDTSGLLVATFGELSFKLMQKLFATRRVRKTYDAVLEGDYVARGIPSQGRIELPLAPDWLDRPRQRVDLVNGKPAATDYAFESVADGLSRITFHPLTGRTHQLRVHAASESGLGMPIAGDRLYGHRPAQDAGRLLLHARALEFTFPLDGRAYSFTSPTPF